MEKFHYTYSAKQQEEVERIRSRYLPPEEDKLAKLRRLDAGASRKAVMWAIVIGVIGTLLLGTGMSLVMTDIGAAFQLTQGAELALGIAVGVFGMAVLALACPVYLRVLRREREKIAPEVLRLADELMK